MARPTVYKDKYPQELIDLMSLGRFDYEIYAKWDVNKDTFYRWLREKPDLKECYELGKTKCLAWWTNAMRDKFTEGDDKGYRYCQLIVTTKFPEFKQDTYSSTNQININNLQVINTKEDYQALLATVKEQAKLLNVIDILPEEMQEITEDKKEENGTNLDDQSS